MAFADFHLHTAYSDGLDAPEAVLQRAARLGCAAMAITDHDTLAGNAAAAAAARELGIEYLPGIEISTEFSGSEIHVIALGIAPDDAALNECLTQLRSARHERAAAILSKLQQNGIDLTAEELAASTGTGAPGRLHIARALLQKGVVQTAQEAFDRFLNPGLPAFVPRRLVPTAEALALIRQSGGLSFIAHPGLSKVTRRLLESLLELPFDGLEAYHISHGPARTREFLRLARQRGLLVSGGSDCHGGAKGTIEMGKVRVPLEVFEQIKLHLPQRQDSSPSPSA